MQFGPVPYSDRRMTNIILQDWTGAENVELTARGLNIKNHVTCFYYSLQDVLIFRDPKEKRPRKVDDCCEHLILFDQSWQNIDATVQCLKVKLAKISQFKSLKFQHSLSIVCLLKSHIIRPLVILEEFAKGWKMFLLKVLLSRWFVF
jgi:hypothetical protein